MAELDVFDKPVALSEAWRIPKDGAVRRYFGTPVNAAITLLCMIALFLIGKVAFTWLFVDAVWSGGPEACKIGEGACWPFFADKLRFMLFGYFPFDEHWRPLSALLLFVGMCGLSMVPRLWSARLLLLWVVVLAVCYLVMTGGFAGMTAVPTTKWGGLPLSFMLSFVGLTCAFPVGILLALGRTSNLPAIRVISIVFIEFMRGVPLISVLFMASVMLPLFMPGGMSVATLLRAQVAVILFAAAYIAETVRGGLQSLPTGQFEAAQAMGLHYWLMMRLIILPQAIKAMIPALVSTCINFFQDTTLVTIIGLLDFLTTVRGAMRDPNWQGIAVLEGYLFAAAVYCLFSAIMSAYSRFLERRFRAGHD
jgi:general L-amino acid transport system permease protein